MFETWKPKDWVARKIADERAIRIATLKEALALLETQSDHYAAPSLKQRILGRIAELERE